MRFNFYSFMIIERFYFNQIEIEIISKYLPLIEKKDFLIVDCRNYSKFWPNI